MKCRQVVQKIFGLVFAVLYTLIGMASSNVMAADTPIGLMMSPMDEKIVLNPGEKYSGSFYIGTASGQTEPIDYKIYIQNFYRNDDGKAIFEEVGETGKIANWITIDVDTEGTLTADSGKKVYYTIDVPRDAPAGGQYAAITVASVPRPVGGSSENSASVSQSVGMAYLIYAEITGTTIHQGEIIDTSLPNFLFSGKITASATIKNTGNVHGTSKYTLQVFPLFSNEEVYTNVEDPETHTIMPDRTYYNETSWDNTPTMGIFNVVYSVEFEGVTTEISKLVIVCPLWLLLIIVFIIVAVVVWLVIRIKMRKKAAEE